MCGKLQWDEDPTQGSLLAPEQLILRKLGQIFNRTWRTERRALGSDQLSKAVAKHAGYVASDEEPPRVLAEQLAKAVSIRRGEALAQARVETIISNLETLIVHNLQADVHYGSTWGSYKRTSARTITEPLLKGCPPEGNKRMAPDRIQCISK